jgi:hypothetical protein
MAMKTKAALLMLMSCLVAGTVPAQATNPAHNKTVAAPTDHAAFRSQILNGVCCVPNMSTGYSPFRLKNGEYKSKDKNDPNEVDISDILFGKLDGVPVAVAVMSQSGGGSGIFNSLLIYEQRDGKAITVGSYPIGDRTIVKSLKIADNQVHLVIEGTIGENGGKQTTLVLPLSKFDKAECLQEPLSGEMKKDVDALVPIWTSIDKRKPTLTPEEKKEALDIINRHQKDREKFATAFRLTLSAGGFGPGEHPLTFDKDGRPTFYIDDLDFHAKIELNGS